MNTPTFTSATAICIKLAALLALTFGAVVARAEWTIDFSRREQKSRDSELLAQPIAVPDERGPASAPTAPVEQHDNVQAETPAKEKGVFDTLFNTGEPVQDLVILQTDHGFLPSTVRVRKNGKYRVSIVNVNEKEKNVSFILEAFSEHHATYYGKVKTFVLEPKKEGSYSFQSPETAAEGKLIVFNPEVSLRAPAGE